MSHAHCGVERSSSDTEQKRSGPNNYNAYQRQINNNSKTTNADDQAYVSIQRSNSTNDIEMDAFDPMKKVVRKRLGGIKYHTSLSQSESKSRTEDQVPPETPFTLNRRSCGAQPERAFPGCTEANSVIFDNTWESVPQNSYFAKESYEESSEVPPKKNHSRQAYEKEKSTPNQDHMKRPITSNAARNLDKPKLKVSSNVDEVPNQEQNQPALSEQMRTSTPEFNNGQPSMLPHVIFDAFSNVDVSLEEASPLEGPQSSLHSLEMSKSPLQTISEAFSDVDISFEQEKTVTQRGRELEYLAKSWTTSSQTENDATPANAKNTDKRKVAASSSVDWAHDPKDTNQGKKKAEPSLRLKGNKKLAQTFASLVKAYESDLVSNKKKRLASAEKVRDIF